MHGTEWRKWGRVGGDGVVCLDVDTFGDGFGMRLSSSCEVLSCWGGSISMSSISESLKSITSTSSSLISVSSDLSSEFLLDEIICCSSDITEIFCC